MTLNEFKVSTQTHTTVVSFSLLKFIPYNCLHRFALNHQTESIAILQDDSIIICYIFLGHDYKFQTSHIPLSKLPNIQHSINTEQEFIKR
jgi:hypothetical protein